MFSKLAVVFSLLSCLFFSCKKDEDNPPSVLNYNGVRAAIDSVKVQYIGDGEAICYFLKKGQSIDSSALILNITSATFESLAEGSYRYKSNIYFQRNFYLSEIEDSIVEANLHISQTEKNYTFDLTIKTDSLTISAHSYSSMKIEDLSGKMIIAGVRHEESKGAQIKQINKDSLQLNIMGSKVSYPQIAIVFPCNNCDTLPLGTYSVTGEESIKAKIYLNYKHTAMIDQGEIVIEKTQNDLYKINYNFSFNDTIISGNYNNKVILRH